MFSLNDESIPSSQSAQPRQAERDAFTETDENDSLRPANRLDSTTKSDYRTQHDLASPTASTSQVDEYSSHLSEEHSDQSEPRPPSRSNKYSGPSSTWRNWTASERKLAQSLDQLTAKDLAIHLYNAHALKKRARKVVAQRKIQSTDDGSDSANVQEWMPSMSWTSWPLRSDLVPRESDGPHWASESQDFCQPNRSRNKYQASRRELQDLLVAQVIKKAKQRNRYLQQKAGEQSETEPESEPESMEQSDDSIITSKPESLDELEPVIMLDNDVANSLLQPMVHHILTKFDGLLAGLHHARSTYDEPKSPSGRSKKKRRISRPRSSGNKSETSVASLTSASATSVTSDDESTGKVSRFRQRSHSKTGERQDQHLRRRRHKPGLRDWSDVLGVASMTGWDTKIVQKAAFRCSTLFDEGIKFRRLEEDGSDSNEISVLPHTSYSDQRRSSDEMLQEDRRSSSSPVRVTDSQGLESDKSEWKIRCPVPSCRRFSRGFSSPYPLKRHIKQVHDGDPTLEKLIVKEREGEMVGGVHVDGFLQPIPQAQSWKAEKKPRQRKASVGLIN